MDGGRSSRHGRAEALVVGLAVASAVFAVAYASIWFTREHGRVAAIWPINALVLILLLKADRRHRSALLTGLLVGNLGANLAAGDGLIRAVLLAGANLVEVILVLAGVGRRGFIRLKRRPAIVRFLGVATLACGVSTAGAVLALWLTGSPPSLAGATIWFAADSLGLMIFAPLGLVLAQGAVGALFTPAQARRTGALLGLVALTTAAVFYQTAFPLLFLVPIVVVLVGFKLGLGGTALAILMVAAISIPLTLGGQGPAALVQGSIVLKVLVLQFFLAALTLTGLVVGAVEADRRQLIHRLGRANARLEKRALRERALLDQARLSEKMSQVGYWTLEPATGTVFWSPEVYRIHGADPAQYQPGLADALDFYLPEDRKRISDLVSEQMGLGQGWAFDATIVRRSDGALRQVRSLAECEIDVSGNVRQIFGVFKDLTDERRMTNQVAESERRYRLIAENATDVIATHGVDGVFTYLSPSVLDMMGYRPEEMTGRSAFDFMHPDDREGVAAAFRVAMGSDETFRVSYRAVRKDGASRWVEVHARAQRGSEGRISEYVVTIRDVTEREDREAALAAARTAAESAAAAKAAFLANMSHEIRTPLNGLLGFAELLEATPLTPDQARYLSRVRSAGTGLARLINDILDFSRVEAGKMPVQFSAVALGPLIEDIVGLVSVGHGSDRIVFATEVDPSLPTWVMADEARVRQVLLNIVGNAAKFTREGSVRLTVSQAGDHLAFQVTDTGPGVEPSRIEALFEGFAQADDSITRRFGGTGLGLSISRSLARLMQGDLTMQSQVGVGTTVTLTLPLKAAEAPAAEEAAPHPIASASSTPLDVLVVDDSEMNLELVDIALTQRGHAVTAVSGGAEALAKLKSGQRFDLVFMDVQMPGMDGLTATRLIRRLPGAARDVVIVGLTANVLPEQVAACREAGMDDHVAKPTAIADLVHVLERVAARRGRGPSKAPRRSSSRGRSKDLGDLTRRYGKHLASLPVEIDRLCLQTEPVARNESLATLAHTLAGTAGSLGFPAVSRAAFELEAAAKHSLMDGEGEIEMRRAVEDMKRALLKPA